MHKLIEVLESIEPLSPEFKEALKRAILLTTLPKNYMLLELAKVAEHAFFLNSGYAMAYRFLHGKKHIEEFYNESRIIVSPKSFFERTPSLEAIQLLEESQVIHISYESVMSLLHTYPEAHRIYQVTMNVYYEESRNRIHDLQHLSAVERYEKLHAAFPRIEQLVPQEYIASYLGIAPQSLSRLKRDLTDD